MMRWQEIQDFNLRTLARAADLLAREQAAKPATPIPVFAPIAQLAAFAHRMYLGLIASLRLDDAIANLFIHGFWLGYYYAQMEAATADIDQLTSDNGESQGDGSDRESG